MMPSAARDPKTLAGGVDESQDRRLGAVELGFPLFMPPGARAAACAISTADGALAYGLGFWLRNFAAS
jgi:hypothetical protein